MGITTAARTFQIRNKKLIKTPHHKIKRIKLFRLNNNSNNTNARKISNLHLPRAGENEKVKESSKWSGLLLHHLHRRFLHLTLKMMMTTKTKTETKIVKEE